MRVAFYAPLKPPTHPLPSGDRRMGRLLMAALAAGGHSVELASSFRSFDPAGDALRQRRLQALGRRLAERLCRRYRGGPADRRPEVWFTYHLYHKAPDWLGPAVADALAIPYVVAEASHAPKQKGGSWAAGHAAAADAIRRADLVFGLNPADARCLRPLLRGDHRLVPLTPFLDPRPYAAAAEARREHRRALARRHRLDEGEPWLLAVAMMRPGDKLRSYRVLGEALAGLTARRWRLLVAGDGPARAATEAALAGLGGRVVWLGAQEGAVLPAVYAAADICVWPAINEAYGMALLEAQASGLPVVAGNAAGVAAIVGDGETGLLAPAGDAAAFAAAVAELLDEPQRRHALGAAARRRVAAEHGLEGAARALDLGLRRLAP